MTMVSGMFAGGAGGPYPGSTARYHKLTCVHSHDGDGVFAPAEVRMLGTFAGSDVSGTYSSSTPLQFTVANVRDNDYLTLVRLQGGGGEIVVDHGAPTTVAEVRLQAPASAPERMPSTLRFHESADGANWTLVREWTQPAWYEQEGRYYAVADESLAGFAGKWRHHRITAQ